MFKGITREMSHEKEKNHHRPEYKSAPSRKTNTKQIHTREAMKFIQANDSGNEKVAKGEIPKKEKIKLITGDYSLLDCILMIVSIGSLLSDIVTDCLVAAKHYSNRDWWWFSLTVSFIVFPSIAIQILSYLYYHHDTCKSTPQHCRDSKHKQLLNNNNQASQDDKAEQWRMYITHLFQVGPVKR